jgi:serine/threonine protein kinase
MKNVMLAEPSTLVLLSMGLMVLLILAILIGAVIVLTVRFLFKKKSPVPPVALSTQILPRKCPQCGAELKSDVPEGLCPACLLQRGIATEGGAPPGTPPFVPPTIPDLAKLFPQLEILELIGKGGMGAVYKARQPSLDRFVALKILAPRSGGDLDFAGRFTREARALAKLSHPNIVAVYDFGQTESLSYFIMEFVDGPNLRQAGKLSPREAMEIIPQICTALQFAHDEGIVHRDIKPENVLLDKKGRVKIADFGLAKIIGQVDFRLTGVRDVMGTPHYMAPEQVEHPQDVDHRADIYSLGVVFYEMLTGELPLGKFQSPSQKVQVDVRLDEVVLRSLAKEPELRYQHVSEVGTRVETIAGSAQGESGERKAESGKQSQSLGTPAASVQPADHFWRRFAVVMACVLLIPVAIAILGLLAAIAIPSFVTARNHVQAIREETAAHKQLELAEQNAPVRSDYIGKTWFPKGDAIEILSVERSQERMAVKGRYNLVSADSAGLTLNITSTNQTGFPEDPNQSIRISKGRGDFELSRSHLVPGLPHVSMYANGGSFAGVYFGTQDEALEESQLDLGPTNAPSASDADQTVAGLPPVVVETQPVSGARDVEPGVAEIRVRFSKEMEDGSWSWSTAWQDSAPESIGQPRYESDRRTCVNKVKLEPGRTYAYWLNSENFHNFKDAADRPAIPYLLIFQTKEK